VVLMGRQLTVEIRGLTVLIQVMRPSGLVVVKRDLLPLTLMLLEELAAQYPARLEAGMAAMAETPTLGPFIQGAAAQVDTRRLAARVVTILRLGQAVPAAVVAAAGEVMPVVAWGSSGWA
jgi:hypothetical protein